MLIINNFLPMLKLCIAIFLINQSYATNVFENILTNPTKLSNCKAQLDDNSIIDLTSLDNADAPRYFFYQKNL